MRPHETRCLAADDVRRRGRPQTMKSEANPIPIPIPMPMPMLILTAPFARFLQRSRRPTFSQKFFTRSTQESRSRGCGAYRRR